LLQDHRDARRPEQRSPGATLRRDSRRAGYLRATAIKAGPDAGKGPSPWPPSKSHKKTVATERARPQNKQRNPTKQAIAARDRSPAFHEQSRITLRLGSTFHPHPPTAQISSSPQASHAPRPIYYSSILSFARPRTTRLSHQTEPAASPLSLLTPPPLTWEHQAPPRISPRPAARAVKTTRPRL
jgi:hypothetical protein